MKAARRRTCAGRAAHSQPEYQAAIIVVTHDEQIISTFKGIYPIRDGRTYVGGTGVA
ncbi:MAG: hypothetical protein ABWU16_06620 [Halothiobacillaceae bacterium]